MVWALERVGLGPEEVGGKMFPVNKSIEVGRFVFGEHEDHSDN